MKHHSNAERATEKMTKEIMDLISQADRSAPPAERFARFEDAAREAFDRMTKEDVVDILMLAILDPEIFLDVLETSASQHETKATGT
jgi:hypothetical protein